MGPFPINALDAARLQQGLAELPPARRDALVVRAAQQVAALRDDFPGDAATGVLTEDEDQRAPFFTRHERLPCPALDPESNLCELFAHRPLSCRTIGPPIRLGETDLPPCELCFVGADPAEIERCRIEPDPNDYEGRVLAALERKRGPGGESIVAFALSRS